MNKIKKGSVVIKKSDKNKIIFIVEKIKHEKVGIGFDASSETYVDMKKAGIVDPTKVTRSALQNAASIASMVLTTESLVTDVPEPKSCNCGGHEGMPGGMEGMY